MVDHEIVIARGETARLGSSAMWIAAVIFALPLGLAAGLLAWMAGAGGWTIAACAEGAFLGSFLALQLPFWLRR